MLPAIVCDLDNTLCVIGDRSPYDGERCAVDTPNAPVLACIHAMRDAGYLVVYMSGRHESARSTTLDWLRLHTHIPDSGYELYMRTEGDNRPDFVVKRELWEKNVIGRLDVAFALDDRRQVVRMLRDDLRVPVFQVNDGVAERNDCLYCVGTGTSKSLVGHEKEAADALADLCTMPTWEPHGAAAERAIKSIVKAVSKARMR
jgi:hypothetical protein